MRCSSQCETAKQLVFVTDLRAREIREAITFADSQKIKIVLADAYVALPCFGLPEFPHPRTELR